MRIADAMKKRVLVVDDDSSVRNSLAEVLRNEDYDVATACDGHEAVRKFHEGGIDLVLLDLNLPVKSGWDCFERLSGINPLIPVVVITARPHQYEMARNAGVGALMEKPLDFPLLLALISELLEEPVEKRLERMTGEHRGTRYIKT